MKLDYHQLMLQTLNQIYQQLKMNPELPWSNLGKSFFKNYLVINNLSEAKQLESHLNEVEKTLNKWVEGYSSELITVFKQQNAQFSITLNQLINLHQQFKSWTLAYNDKNLLLFNENLFKSFQNELEFITLNYKQIFLAQSQTPLIKYLSSLNEVLLDKNSNGVEWMNQISDFFFKISDFLQEIKHKNQVLSNFSEEMYVNLQNFAFKTKNLVSLYYHWLNTNQVVDQNAAKYLSLYI